MVFCVLDGNGEGAQPEHAKERCCRGGVGIRRGVVTGRGKGRLAIWEDDRQPKQAEALRCFKDWSPRFALVALKG
jgi:hypothetical protein